MASLLAKWSRFLTIIKQNGGIRGSIVMLFRTDELKDGTLVGEDYLGNKYYKNDRYFLGRNRWVVYGNRFGWDYEGSQIPPEWHRWLHYMTDETPIQNPPERHSVSQICALFYNKAKGGNLDPKVIFRSLVYDLSVSTAIFF
uniref:NADH dehydrogenase [ubiquinone] 1 alpha subcomplex subunit 12 n=1 Tax=Echinococcus granulosus TaxID=6210 RepID=A0A068WAW4_ECHGR|nr:NADH:ubiquinone oxidoreductase [Echinococcus granulosus]